MEKSLKKSQALKEIIRTNWGKYKSTSKMSEELGIPMRTIQHYILKLQREEGITLPGYVYRQLLTEKEEPVVLATEKDLTHLQRSTDTEIFDDGQEDKKPTPQFGQQIEDTLKDGVVIVFSDAHVTPKKLSSAQKAMLTICKELNPDMVINLGDIFDFASISSHDKMAWEDRFTLEDELEAGIEYMQSIQKATPTSKKYFLYSNHDCRFNKFLAKHAPQFRGVKGFSLEDHVPKEWINCMSLNLNKNTMFLHQYNGGVHAGYNNVVKSGISIVTGHTHIMECKPFTDYNGTRYGIQTGTLSSIQDNPFFNYTVGTPLNWIAGFIVLTYINGELQMPEFCTINKDNKAVFRGKIVK